MTRYMLDTNTVSYIMRNPVLQNRLNGIDADLVCISSITEAELHYGIAKKPENVRNKQLITLFLAGYETLPFDSEVASEYGKFRVLLEKEGLSLGAHDLLIAAHSRALNLVLISSDKAFYHASHLLKLENWMQ